MTYIWYSKLGQVDLDLLIHAAQTAEHDDSREMNEIIRRFAGLAHRVAHALRAPDHLHDDLANAARIGLVKAVRHHDGRHGFPAYAELYMRGAAMREYRCWILPETADTEAVERIQAPQRDSGGLALVEDRLAPWGGGKMATVIDTLKPGQRKVVELRYEQDLPVKDIARSVGTSGPAVSQRLATVHRAVALALAA